MISSAENLTQLLKQSIKAKLVNKRELKRSRWAVCWFFVCFSLQFTTDLFGVLAAYIFLFILVKTLFTERMSRRPGKQMDLNLGFLT